MDRSVYWNENMKWIVVTRMNVIVLLCDRQTDSSELRRGWSMWQSKNSFHSISCYILWLYWLMCLQCSWINFKSKYIPLYHVQFCFQCIKQCMNQYNNTQRSVTTAGYVELRWPSVSNKLSPRLQQSAVLPEAKCSLSAVAAVCWYLFEWFDGVWREEGGRAEYYI